MIWKRAGRKNDRRAESCIPTDCPGRTDKSLLCRQCRLDHGGGFCSLCEDVDDKFCKGCMVYKWYGGVWCPKPLKKGTND